MVINFHRNQAGAESARAGFAPENFGDALRAAVGTEKDPKVVIRGDSKLNFREVRQAMIAIEDAGFRGVGLAAKGPSPKAKGD